MVSPSGPPATRVGRQTMAARPYIFPAQQGHGSFMLAQQGHASIGIAIIVSPQHHISGLAPPAVYVTAMGFSLVTSK